MVLAMELRLTLETALVTALPEQGPLPTQPHPAKMVLEMASPLHIRSTANVHVLNTIPALGDPQTAFLYWEDTDLAQPQWRSSSR